MLGIYVSGHPLESFESELKAVSSIMTTELSKEIEETTDTLRDGQKITIGGIIVEKKNKITRNNNMMAFITLEDLYGSVECIVFPATFERYNKYISEDQIITIEGRLSVSEVEETKIICEKISPLNKSSLNKLYVKLSKNSRPNLFNDIKDILRKYPGETPVYVFLEESSKTVIAERALWIKSENNGALVELQSLLGKDNVKLS